MKKTFLFLIGTFLIGFSLSSFQLETKESFVQNQDHHPAPPRGDRKPEKKEKPKKEEKNTYKIKTRYIFGFSFSFSDSTVYFTDVQKIDSAQVGSHNKFVKCAIYSDQFRAYLKSQGVQTPTVAIFNRKSMKSASKLMNKVMKKYGDPRIKWKVLPQTEFKFE